MQKKTKNILIISGLVVAALFIAIMMARFEVAKRAKREYLEGEKYLKFHKNPDTKKIYYDDKLKKEEITEPQYKMLMEDKALKNAYVRYQTVIDLFTPPESKWVKKSRRRLSEIKPEYDAWVNKLKAEIEKAANTPVKTGK